MSLRSEVVSHAFLHLEHVNVSPGLTQVVLGRGVFWETVPSICGRCVDSMTLAGVELGPPQPHQRTHAAENTQLNYLAVDWQAACILRQDREAQTACKRQSQASEPSSASVSASLKTKLRR